MVERVVRGQEQREPGSMRIVGTTRCLNQNRHMTSKAPCGNSRIGIPLGKLCVVHIPYMRSTDYWLFMSVRVLYVGQRLPAGNDCTYGDTILLVAAVTGSGTDGPPIGMIR